MSRLPSQIPKCINCMFYKTPTKSCLSATKIQSIGFLEKRLSKKLEVINLPHSNITSMSEADNENICGRVFLRESPKIETFYYPSITLARNHDYLCGTHGKYYVDKNKVKESNISHMIG